MNEVVKDMIKTQLEANPRSRPGDLAYLLEQYEALKHKLDHRNMTGPLILHTADDRCMVAISQEALSNAFDNAFSEALRPGGLLDVEMRTLLDLGEDFAIVFCGGSFMSSVLRRRVEERLDDWNSIARNKGVVIRHCFLSNVDTAATTAVACGAALSAMRVPPLAKVMEGAAVGIQTLVKVKDQAVLAVDNVVQWDEEEYADFLFGVVSTKGDTYLCYGLILKLQNRVVVHLATSTIWSHHPFILGYDFGLFVILSTTRLEHWNTVRTTVQTAKQQGPER